MDLEEAREISQMGWPENQKAQRQHDAVDWLVAEVERLTVLVYGKYGLDERLKAADLGWAYWQTKARSLQSSLTLSREEGRREGMERAAEIAESHAWLVRDANCYRGKVNQIAGEAAGWIDGVAAAIRSEAKGERSECTWTLQDDETGAWASTCGELWSFIDGGPQENRVRFCHGCGKPVKAQALFEME